LLAQVLQKPALSEKEFAELQRERVAKAEQDLPEPQPQAINAFRRLIDATPEGHVRHVATLPAELANLKAVTVADVKAFHAAYYGTSNATFAAVGDFDAAALKAQVTSLYGNWKAAQPYVRIPAAVKPVSGEKITLETPDKANSVLFAIQPLPLKDDAAVYPALLMANHMLGGGALRSRLADRIRQKEGLSYGVSSQLNVPSREPAAYWMAYAISAPQNTLKVEAALREEIAKVLADGFTEAELVEAKKGWLQSEEVGRTQDTGLARELAGYLAEDRTMAYDKDLEAKVAALTLAQVNQGLRDYLKPEAVSVVTAGDFAKVAKEGESGAKAATSK